MITPLEDERKTACPSASFHRSNEIGSQDIQANLLHRQQEVWAILFLMEVTLASTMSANKNLDEDANTNTELLKHSCRVLLLYLMPRTTSRNGKSVSVDDQMLSIAAITAATWYQDRVELDGSSMLHKVIAEKIESGASVL